MNWLNEDPELLRAALEIIDSWDSESSVNGVAVTSPSPATEETDSTNDDAGGGDDSEVAPTSAAANPISEVASQAKGDSPTPPAVPTSDRFSATRRERKPSTISTLQRRRDEILYLRHKISYMESQLETLHKQNAAGASSATLDTSGVGAALAVSWYDIASRQLWLRQKAELEQVKLRGLVETQMRVARGLIKLMQRARRIEEDESFPTAKRAKLPITVSVGMSEDEQCAHVDKLYLDMGEAFSFARFHDGTVKFIDVEVLDRGDDDVVIEFRDAWALPFEIDAVMDAVWAFMGKPVEQKGTHEDALIVDAVRGDTFTQYFSGSARVGVLKGTFDGKGISKRFPGIGRRHAAIVSSMFTLPHHDKGGELEGIRLREDAFLRVVSAQSLTGQSGGRVLSVAQSNRRFRMTFDVDKAPASRRNAGVLTDFVLGQITQERQLKLETVETLLLHLRSH